MFRTSRGALRARFCFSEDACVSVPPGETI